MQQKAKTAILINLPPAPDYNYHNAGSIYPATGILVVGTILKNQGMNVKVIDGALKSDYIKKVFEFINKDAAFVGFSVMTSQVSMAFNLSKLIKENHPDVPIIWGGIHPILFPEQTVMNPNIDIVVTGDGCETVLNLVDYVKGNIDLKAVKGIGFKDISGNIFFTETSEADNINNIPHIDFSILDDVEIYLNATSTYKREIASDNNEKLRVMPILTGLGCSYKCQFCINVILERRYRFRPAESIVGEIKRLKTKYDANTFIFYDEDFLISKKRLTEFLDLLEKDNLKFYCRIWARVNYFRDNYLNKGLILRLERNGLRSMVMGAESGSQRVLDLIQKGIKVENVLHSAKMLNGTKITARYSFIVGLDGEEKTDTKKTYKLCRDLMNTNKKVDIAGPFIFRYYPGSPIFDRIVKKYNITIPTKIEEWEDVLSEEGYLKIEKMPWVWHGCVEIATILNKEIYIYDRLRNFNNLISTAIKALIKWRLNNFNTKFLIELYAFNFIKKLKKCIVNSQVYE